MPIDSVISNYDNSASSSSSSSANMDVDTLNARIKSQIATELVQTITSEMEKECFTRCIRRPDAPMSKVEELCLSRCMDRFLESWSVVSKTVLSVNQKLLQMAQQKGGDKQE